MSFKLKQPLPGQAWGKKVSHFTFNERHANLLFKMNLPGPLQAY